MGQTISSTILPLVTMNWDEWSDWYEFDIKPYIWIPAPQRIVAINWSRLASNIVGLIWDGIQRIPGLIWGGCKLVVKIVDWCLRNALYPTLIGITLIIGYYVMISMSETGVISPRRLKASSQYHFLSNQRSGSSHPLRVYADETNSI